VPLLARGGPHSIFLYQNKKKKGQSELHNAWYLAKIVGALAHATPAYHIGSLVGGGGGGGK